MEELEAYKRQCNEQETENERLKQEIQALRNKMSSNSNLPNMETNMSYLNSNSFTNNNNNNQNTEITPFKDSENEGSYSNTFGQVSNYFNRETSSNILGAESPNTDATKSFRQLNDNLIGHRLTNISRSENAISPIINNNYNYTAFENVLKDKQFSLNFGRLYDEKQKNMAKTYKTENPYVLGIQNNVK
jgi:hypothetical protein